MFDFNMIFLKKKKTFISVDLFLFKKYISGLYCIISCCVVLFMLNYVYYLFLIL